MPTFDLVAEPWIPVVLRDGTPAELSLEATLANSHEIRELYDPSPLVTAALVRLLLAILHRNFGPHNFEAWKRLWAAQQWDTARLHAYFEEWRERFDLFHPERPFYQVPELAARPQSVARLSQEAASGNNPTLFDHRLDATPTEIRAAEAARLVIATQTFAVGGGVSEPFNLSDAPLTRGLSVLAIGQTLFETLALNLLPYNDRQPMPGGPDDAPAWEQAQARAPARQGTPPLGYLDYLTWQSRRIHLFPEGNSPTVALCQVQQNLKLADRVLDPFKSYAVNKDAGYVPLRFQAERAVWRDSHTLLLETEGPDRARRPEVFNHLQRIREARDDGLAAAEAYGFAALGLGTAPGQARVDFWRHERLPLPLSYLADRDLLHTLGTALELGESVARALRIAVQKLVRLSLSPSADQGGRAPRREDIDPIVRALGTQRAYWAGLDTAFTELFVHLPLDRIERDGVVEYGLGMALTQWRDSLRNAAVRAFQSATTALNMNVRTMKAVAEAERAFYLRLRAAFASE